MSYNAVNTAPPISIKQISIAFTILLIDDQLRSIPTKSVHPDHFYPYHFIMNNETISS